MQQKNNNSAEIPILSVVVIAYNEAPHIAVCLQSVHDAQFSRGAMELIFVDGGSQDDTLAIAQEGLADVVLQSDVPRKAAGNRNAGLAVARGTYVQFLDGDMELDPDWLEKAVGYMEEHSEVAAVAGRLEERNTSVFYQALQLDWGDDEGPVPYCGGAGLFHRETLVTAGGFPEEVAYGEEPLLCWELRNTHGKEIHQLQERMALHDLAYTGILDYLKRNVRVGETYQEIGTRLKDTDDPLWSYEIETTPWWALGIILLIGGIFSFVGVVQVICLCILGAILGRKVVQRVQGGTAVPVAVVYSLHIYSCKLSHAWGMLRYKLRQSS